MLILDDWAQRIITLREVNTAELLVLPWPYMFHMVIVMTIFLLFPFSRLVHVWSGFASVGYLFRPYQVVRSRRLDVGATTRTASRPQQPVQATKAAGQTSATSVKPESKFS
jgi:nitrate reductase gamma subunit